MNEKSLFSVPYWEIPSTEIEPFREEMIKEVEELIDLQLKERSEERYLAHQTKTDPFRLPSKGWEILDLSMKRSFSRIIREKLPRYVNGELHIRRWAIRYGTLSVDESLILREESIHNHCPALLTSVFYLNVPDEISSKSVAKTRFFNCLPPISKQLTPRHHDLGGESGTLIIFPGDIEHTSLCEEWVATTENKRIVVVADVYFVGGFQNRPSDDSVLRVTL